MQILWWQAAGVMKKVTGYGTELHLFMAGKAIFAAYYNLYLFI